MEKNQLADISDLPQTVEVQAGLIATHCYRDRDYRNQLIDDAQGTLLAIARNFYQENIKDEATKEKALARIEAEKDLGLDIVVCQNTATKWHIPLPPAGGHKVLSEEELQQASGGEIGVSIGIAVAVVGLAVGTAAALAGTGYVIAQSIKGRITR